MSVKSKTVMFIIIGCVYSLTPTALFALLNGYTAPSYTINSVDILLIFAFSFMPLLIGFVAGKMYANDAHEIDLLTTVPMRKNKGH